MLRVWEPYNLHALYSTCFLGWVCTLTDRAQQPLTTAGEELDYLDHDLSDLSEELDDLDHDCLLYTSPSPRDKRQSRMPSSA